MFSFTLIHNTQVLYYLAWNLHNLLVILISSASFPNNLTELYVWRWIGERLAEIIVIVYQVETKTHRRINVQSNKIASFLQTCYVIRKLHSPHIQNNNQNNSLKTFGSGAIHVDLTRKSVCGTCPCPFVNIFHDYA